MASKKIQYAFFFTMFLAVIIIMLLVLRPFLSSLVLALAFAIVLSPLYERSVRICKGNRTIAALLFVASVMIVVLIPLFFLGQLLFGEARSLYTSIAGSGNGFLGGPLLIVENYIRKFSPDFTFNVSAYLEYGLQWFISHLDAFFSSFLHILLALIIMILALYYLLKDGRMLRAKFIALSPLPNLHDEEILSKLTLAIGSVIKGSLVIALVQGILAGAGTALFGLSNPIIWGVCATIASFIPGVGTSLVMVPAMIYLLITGHSGSALGLLIWQVFVVSLVDNFLSPHLLRRGMNIHPFLILLSVLGGISLFGPIGFILGPVVLAFFFALLDIYPVIINSHD